MDKTWSFYHENLPKTAIRSRSSDNPTWHLYGGCGCHIRRSSNRRRAPVDASATSHDTPGNLGMGFFKLVELKLVKKGLRLKGHYSWLLNFSEWWYKTYQPILKKLFSILQGSKVPKGLICLVPCIVRAWHVKDPTLDTSKTSLLFWLSYKRVSWSCCLVVSFWS